LAKVHVHVACFVRVYGVQLLERRLTWTGYVLCIYSVPLTNAIHRYFHTASRHHNAASKTLMHTIFLTKLLVFSRDSLSVAFLSVPCDLVRGQED